MNRTGGTAIVTGATSGIGAAYARRLAADGYRLLLHGRRGVLLEEVARDIRERCGVPVETLLAELGVPEGVRLLEARVRATPDLAVLVNNAGYSTLGLFHQEDIDGQERLVHTHVNATIRLTHAALTVMLPRRSGTIINVSSVAGFMASPGSTTYCATKAYLITFTESVHLEVAGSGVRVQVLCPGFTKSDFHRRQGYDTSDPWFRRFMSADRVVGAAMRDLERGRVVSVPGWQYKMSVLVTRWMPRRLFYGAVRLWRRRNVERRPAGRS